MAPLTVDALVVTFNCAKTFVNPTIFANHLQTGFANHATALPDIVVFSLQEVAPLSQSFIGNYFLNPYFERFDDAINLAAHRHRQNGNSSRETLVSVTQTGASSAPSKAPDSSYTLLAAHNVGYTAIMVFALDPERIHNLQLAEVGFGAAEMGNKGAVAARMLYSVDDMGPRSTELTFVAPHLAAMEWNLHRRNANWAAIMRCMTFSDPEAILNDFRGPEGTPPPGQSGDDSDQGSDDRHRLLHETSDEEHLLVRRALHDVSVFKPTTHVFVAGDLNYRISTSSPPPNAAFPSLYPSSDNYYPTFLPLDQLTRERKAGRTLHGLTEHEIRFPPTYKYDVQPKQSSVSDEDEAHVPWKFAQHRYPSWTDRILFTDLPPWVKSRSDKPKMEVLAYDALPVMRSSDHRPVYLRIKIPLVAPDAMRPPASVEQNPDSESLKDPRVRLPVEVDPEAWARRRAARQKELVTGWSAFLWSTKEGALVLATLLAGGLATWSLYRTW